LKEWREFMFSFAMAALALLLPVGSLLAQSSSLMVTPSSFSFSLQNGTALTPVSTQLMVTSSGAALNASASTGTSWLSVGGAGGQTPASFIVGLNGGQFLGSDGKVNYAAGTYQGSVIVTAPGASNSPMTVPVVLTITGGTSNNNPTLNTNLSSLTFNVQNGPAASNAPQAMSITSSGAPLTFTVSSGTTSGGNWLSVSGTGGVTPASLTVSLNLAAITTGNVVNLAPGAYKGSITIAANGAANTPLIVPVTLNVASAPLPLNISTTLLAFNFERGASPPPAQTVSISVSAGSALTFTATPEASGNWLSVTQSGPATPATLNISVNPAGLTPGTYQGDVLVTAAGASNSPQKISVSLVVKLATPRIQSVLNSASGVSVGVSPGEVVTISGSALGPAAPVSLHPAPSGLVDTTLAGTRVWFDSTAAPLVFVSDSQVSAVVPYELAGKSSTQIQVEVDGVKSAAVPVSVGDTVPGIFTINQTGSGQGAVLNQDYSVNSPSTPAPAGSVVMIYATGEGQTTPAGVDGLLTNGTLRSPMGTVSVTIGGQPADVLYAGSAPDLIAGVLQVNVRVPDAAGHGIVPIVLKVGQASSQSGVTMALQ
jgi:uncharacterized protein (TIGR03437 family)